jgi:type IV secretory pathway VirB10-like protein
MVRLTLTGDFAMIRIVLFAFALLPAFAAQAQVYKCVDAKGVTVYRQDPCPPTMKREAMSKPAIAPAPAAAPAEAADKSGKAEAKKGPMTPAEQEQAFRQRQQDAAKASKEADEKANQAKIKEQNCNNARQRLATYSFGGRISKIDANGERYYVEDSEIAAGKAQAQADIASMCN